jgi:excinuclease UvrABC nuclease subunit
MNNSVLDEIPGIVEKTKELLLKKFGSVKKIAAVPAQELESVVGKKKAAIITAAFQYPRSGHNS